jgi:hypothetical protein
MLVYIDIEAPLKVSPFLDVGEVPTERLANEYRFVATAASASCQM